MIRKTGCISHITPVSSSSIFRVSLVAPSVA
jgi:hypothetical protein